MGTGAYADDSVKCISPFVTRPISSSREAGWEWSEGGRKEGREERRGKEAGTHGWKEKKKKKRSSRLRCFPIGWQARREEVKFDVLMVPLLSPSPSV